MNMITRQTTAILNLKIVSLKIDIGELLGQHHRVAKSRKQDRRPEPHPGRDPGQVGQGRQRVEPRLGHDAVAHPDRVIAGLVGTAGHGPAGSRGGRRADSITTPRVGMRTPMRMGGSLPHPARRSVSVR